MSIIRRALLIVPATVAAFAFSGGLAQADTIIIFGDDNDVTNTHTTNNLTWIDDSFNDISTVDVDVDGNPDWWGHGDDGHDWGGLGVDD
ncbi:hypothetical protein ABZ816_06800 [Actinosynnema sp. NPDC047251]|uniref:Putative secreted protein n=1 Tax=Saccharothrix espanaensis (strain ATCC 51144 / DSM 44229 / JCM 9112 / NBRC 15066 / NRRL 15764) TaxID=1179773 RepID=K0JNV3_SACES|nr:hypothetical protein [Saccharothrix espanaensis]CCH27835.1 putative secreted protein [Saccharothrix espanaensis DSM 44229]